MNMCFGKLRTSSFQNCPWLHFEDNIRLWTLGHSIYLYTLSRLPWKHINHWIYSVLLISVSKWHDFNTISEKRSIKKFVQEDDLSFVKINVCYFVNCTDYIITCHIYKSKEFTEKVSIGPEIVLFKIRVEVIDEQFLLKFFVCIRLYTWTRAMCLNKKPEIGAKTQFSWAEN